MKMKWIQIITMVLLASGLPATSWAQVETISFTEGWELRAVFPDELPDALRSSALDEKRRINIVKMPAMVHDILLENQLIDTPWLADGAERCTWVPELEWEYSIQFEPPAKGKQAFLLCKGLDGISEIYLNDRKIAVHANCHIPLRVDLTGKIREENSLRILFKPAVRNGEPVRKTVDDRQVRRPNQNYINYLGPFPYFSRVGIFDAVQLVTHDGSMISDFLPLAGLNESLDEGSIEITTSGILGKGDHSLMYQVHDPDGNLLINKEALLENGQKTYDSKTLFRLSKPQIWWPRGYGDQPLYTISASLMKNGVVLHEVEKRVGFRHVEMTDTLHFRINGQDVKWWGGDWVTPHWNTMVWDHEKATKLLDMAEHANFNAFRIWGVVEAPPDDFYEMAAERGFLLWQDFTQMPLGPGENNAAVREAEGTYLLKRLRHNPSILVWCGGNENAMWHHQEYNGPMEDRGNWQGTVGASMLEKLVADWHPGTLFFPTSPYYGIDPNDPKHGNTHGYTNMWFVPGYDYLNFASEDTRISPPPVHSLEKMMLPGDPWPSDYSPVYREGDLYPFPETWLRYTTSRSWKKLGPVEHYYDGHNLDALVYRLGMASAEYYRETIERQRRGRPADDTTGKRQCGGYLVWKFNDSWPQVYSAKVDYFLEPYHTYYALKDAYAPVLVSIDIDTYIRIWVVNDTPEEVSGTLTFKLFHKDLNETRKVISRKVRIAPGASEVCIDLYREGIGSFREEHILFAELQDDEGSVIHRTTRLADIERNLEFPDARLDVRIEGDSLRITTDRYAHSVTLEGEKDPFGWFFSDNYFTLLPGEVKYVRVLGEKAKGTIRAKAWYSSYETMVDWYK